MEFKKWQPQVVGVDGQLGQEAAPQVMPSLRSKPADRGCYKTLPWTVTYYSENDRFKESFQSQRGCGHRRKPTTLLYRRMDV